MITLVSSIRNKKYYSNLQEYLQELENNGKLVRVTEAVNKDTEMHPLVRLQFRGLDEKDRKAFLFENIYDSKGEKYDIPVALCAMAGSTEIYALGMQCEPEEIAERWAFARAHPIAPVIASSGPVQETVIQGDELAKKGLSRLPVPISTPGFDNAPYTTSSHWVSKDPETGVHNVGNYRGMIKSETKIGCFCASKKQGLRQHVDKWRATGAKTMPTAVVIGVPPSVSYTAVSHIPHEISEYDIAGGIAGEPLELVKCKTVDLLVPAQAEIVIEGNISLEELEMEGPFGEFTGYMARRDYSYAMDVTCITMRQKPVYQAFFSQFPPSESSKLRRLGKENAIRRSLTERGFDNVLDIHVVEASGSWGVILVKIRKQNQDDGQKVLKMINDRLDIGKICIVVDEDIDIYDPGAVYWALGFNMQPHRDVSIVDVPRMSLDPSIVDPQSGRDNLSEQGERSTALLIDATRDWSYPPIALPKKQYMERAVEIWERLEFPKLQLKEPWFGYSLGYWQKEDENEAVLAALGDYYLTGEKHGRLHRRSFKE